MLWLSRVALAAMIAFGSFGAHATAADVPPAVIFDTDICGDCDDVLALAMLHSLETRGVCKLVAVTVSVDNEKAAPFVDAVNTFYGRGAIPIGVVGEGGVVEPSKYLGIVDQTNDKGVAIYPHDLTSGKDAPSAVQVLRKALASQPDHSVSVVQVGFSTNLARLLDSGPDDVSPLSGIDLVKQKVKVLSLMAAAFKPIDGNPRYIEYNVVKDIPACQSVVKRWPTEVVFSGFEIGIALPYPAVSIERDYGYVPNHIVTQAYIHYIPPPHNRPTWDLTSVLYAALPDRGYFDLSAPGKATIENDGSSTFVEDAQGMHRYLILKPEQQPRVLEALVQLSSQPPQRFEAAKP